MRLQVCDAQDPLDPTLINPYHSDSSSCLHKVNLSVKAIVRIKATGSLVMVARLYSKHFGGRGEEDQEASLGS